MVDPFKSNPSESERKKLRCVKYDQIFPDWNMAVVFRPSASRALAVADARSNPPPQVSRSPSVPITAPHFPIPKVAEQTSRRRRDGWAGKIFPPRLWRSADSTVRAHPSVDPPLQCSLTRQWVLHSRWSAACDTTDGLPLPLWLALAASVRRGTALHSAPDASQLILPVPLTATCATQIFSMAMAYVAGVMGVAKRARCWIAIDSISGIYRAHCQDRVARRVHQFASRRLSLSSRTHISVFEQNWSSHVYRIVLYI
jgi:hypothetical protein